MQETRTAGMAAERLRAAGCDVTPGVGQTGVVGVLRNGDGPTVMLQPVMHAWVTTCVGGTNPDMYAKAKASGRTGERPANHNPRFAPVRHPMLETGVIALIVASRAWLAVQGSR